MFIKKKAQNVRGAGGGGGSDERQGARSRIYLQFACRYYAPL